MPPFRRTFYCGFSLLLLFSVGSGLMVTEKPTVVTTKNTAADVINESPGPLNRLSPSHRTSAHIGYVDDDADDVIHIIEPPKHFELLKMLVQHRMPPNKRIVAHKIGAVTAVNDQLLLQTQKLPFHHKNIFPSTSKTGQKYSNRRMPVVLSPPPTAPPPHQPPPSNGLPLEVMASVRKWERFMNKGRPSLKPGSNQGPSNAWPKQRIKTKKVQTVLDEHGYVQKQVEQGEHLQLTNSKLSRKERVRRDTGAVKAIDGVTQSENQMKLFENRNRNYLNKNMRRQKSVGMTHDVKNRNRYNKNNKNKLGFLLKLKLKEFTQKTAVISSKTSNEKNESERKREIPHVSRESPNHSFMTQQQNTELTKGLVRQRKRRETETKTDKTKSPPTTTPWVEVKAEARTGRKPKPPRNSHYKSFQFRGNQLLDHITDLLDKAEYVVADPLPGRNKSATNSSMALDSLGMKWHLDTQPKELIGEINPKERQENEKTLKKQKQIERIIESSKNTTNAIMEGLKQIQNAVNSRRLHRSSQDNKNVTRENSEISSTMYPNKRFGERIHEKSSSNLNHFIKTPLTQRHLQPLPVDLLKEPSTTKSNIASLSLLYSDVMANIRNMLQAKNLSELEEELKQQRLNRKRLHDAGDDADFVLVPPPKVLIRDATDPADYSEFRHLNKYLNELQSIVKDFVDPATTELVLNSYEYTSSTTTTTTAVPSVASKEKENRVGSTATPTPIISKATDANDWFLINSDGRIYQTHLAVQQRPTVTVFHRFPDIPNADLYLRNSSDAGVESSQIQG